MYNVHTAPTHIYIRYYEHYLYAIVVPLMTKLVIRSMTAFALVCFICGVKKLLNVYTLYTREVVEGLVQEVLDLDYDDAVRSIAIASDGGFVLAGDVYTTSHDLILMI